jgi:hypothetical protein
MYLNYLARFVKPRAQVGIALAAFLSEIDETVPAHKEANETFYLDLFGLSSNAQFAKNRGLGTIRNDV